MRVRLSGCFVLEYKHVMTKSACVGPVGLLHHNSSKKDGLGMSQMKKRLLNKRPGWWRTKRTEEVTRVSTKYITDY